MEENNNIVEENEQIIEDTNESIDNNEDTSEKIEKESVEKEVEKDGESEEDNTNDESKESTKKESQSEEDDKEVESKSSRVIFIIVITVIVLLLLGLVGVLVYFNTHNEIKDDTAPKKETKEVVEVNSKNEMSNEWKEYVISVYNKTIKLPTTYERVEALSGFKLDSTTSKNYMKANSNDIVNLFVEDKLALYVYVKNDNDKEIEYTNSKVVGIWQSKYQVETNHAEKFIFPGNLVVGQEMNKDTLVSLFGEPSNVKNTNLENYISEDYYYYEDEKCVTEKFYRITVVNGKISDIYLVTEK